MFLKPAQGRTVADPERGDQLPAEGREVQLTQYWQRRIADRDVVEGQPSTEAAEAANTEG